MLDNKVILVGYAGHGYVVADVALENKLNILGYAENTLLKNNPFSLNYLGNERENDFFINNKEGKFLIGIGDNKIREKIYHLILEKERDIITLISKSASISQTAIIGKGSFINKNVSINAFAKIGHNVILNTACIIEHDCIVGGSSHIAPGAVLAGNVNVGERTFIGANAVIKQGVKIGNDVIVGAGSVVIHDIPNNQKVVGNPCRLI